MSGEYLLMVVLRLKGTPPRRVFPIPRMTVSRSQSDLRGEHALGGRIRRDENGGLGQDSDPKGVATP